MIYAWAVLLLAASAPSHHDTPPAVAPAVADEFGHVAFANSGAPAAQRDFLDGLALLHDFEYPSAAAAFRRAQAIDPGFVMAYWGEAMTFNHPVWMEQDLPAARAALARLAPTPALRLAKAKTAREGHYLTALERLYGDGTKEERDRAYADAMAALHALYPDDVDATAFAALALLGTAHQGRDYATYMRAAALLEAVFPTHRTHPGIVHYLIHSYDDPAHARLGLPAARLYGRIAPRAGHALHMTSHIFLALGMWRETIDANVAAMRVVNEQLAAQGRPPAHCGHYDLWLHYAWLQSGDVAATRLGDITSADAVAAACRPLAEATLRSAGPATGAPARSRLASYLGMQARRAIETGSWAGTDTSLVPGQGFLAPRFRLVYAEAMVSRRDTARLRALALSLHALAGQLREQRAPLGAEQTEATDNRMGALLVMTGQVDALVLISDGKLADGLAALRAAEARELALPVEFGPPEILKPSAELLGDVLLEARRYAEAEAAFDRALVQAPNRRAAARGRLDARTAQRGPARPI
jgi:hypothetical protein